MTITLFGSLGPIGKKSTNDFNWTDKMNWTHQDSDFHFDNRVDLNRLAEQWVFERQLNQRLTVLKIIKIRNQFESSGEKKIEKQLVVGIGIKNKHISVELIRQLFSSIRFKGTNGVSDRLDAFFCHPKKNIDKNCEMCKSVICVGISLESSHKCWYQMNWTTSVLCEWINSGFKTKASCGFYEMGRSWASFTRP